MDDGDEEEEEDEEDEEEGAVGSKLLALKRTSGELGGCVTPSAWLVIALTPFLFTCTRSAPPAPRPTARRGAAPRRAPLLLLSWLRNSARAVAANSAAMGPPPPLTLAPEPPPLKHIPPGTPFLPLPSLPPLPPTPRLATKTLSLLLALFRVSRLAPRPVFTGCASVRLMRLMLLLLLLLLTIPGSRDDATPSCVSKLSPPIEDIEDARRSVGPVSGCVPKRLRHTAAAAAPGDIPRSSAFMPAIGASLLCWSGCPVRLYWSGLSVPSPMLPPTVQDGGSGGKGGCGGVACCM